MKKYVLYVSLSYAIWGLLPIFWKLLGRLDPVCVLAVRVLFSMLFSVLLLLFEGRFKEVRAAFLDRRLFARFALCGVLICLNWGLFIYAVNSGHILDSSLAYFLCPLLSVAFAAVVFREKLSPTKWTAVGVALCGVLVSAVGSGGIPWLALCIAASFVCYGALKKGLKARSEISLFMETMIVSPLALIYLIWAHARGAGVLQTFAGAELLLLPAAGIVTSIPLLIYSAGIRKVPFSTAGILMYINPSLELLLGVFLYKEEFTRTNAVSFALVWLALALFMAGDYRLLRKGREKYAN